jgi:excisionase family DNA binding protein
MSNASLSGTKRALTVAEFCHSYNVSKTLTYQLMNEGRLRSLKVGAKRLIPTDAAEAWLASLADAA